MEGVGGEVNGRDWKERKGRENEAEMLNTYIHTFFGKRFLNPCPPFFSILIIFQ